jgi:class 3 adenylate cyclase/tetratricopeptide (TPR) repeat protein
MSVDGAPSIVTLLFTDIVGSTSMTDDLGDHGAQEIVRLHNALVRREVLRTGGSEVKTMGDGFMIAFKSVSSAIQCAVSIQRAIQQHNQENPSSEFAVRMGLNAGEAIQEEEDFFGTAVIIAARINALADGGEILVSEAVKQLAQGMRGVDFNFKGEFTLKGLREQYRIYQVTPLGQADAITLRRSQFVGRDKELAALRNHLDQTSGGRGRLVLLAGEAGVGKTRLADEVLREARSRGFRVWRGHCNSTEGAPPYLPFVEALRQYVDERPDDVLADELGEEAGEIARLVPEVSRRLPIKPLGVPLPPEQERFRLLEAVRILFSELIRRRPLLFIIDDVHWIDEASCLLLRHLAQMVSTSPMLLLLTARADELPAAHPLTPVTGEFGRFQAYNRVDLKGLEPADVLSMLESLAAAPPPATLAQTLFEGTEGNAFFLIELITHLHSENLLFDQSGNWNANLGDGALDVPHSIRAVIDRRLAALTDNARKVFSLAAVVGRQFGYELLDALQEVDSDTLLDSLDEGVRMGMVQPVERSAAEFRFTHQLTQQALYDGIPALRRQKSHCKTAEALAASRAGEPEAISYHYLQAGSMAPAGETRRYLILAGEKARSLAAWEDAADHFGRAIELSADVPVAEHAQLLWRLGEAQGGKGDWESAVGTLTQAMDAYERSGEVESMAWIAYSLRRLYGARGQFKEAAEVVQRALASLGDADSEVRSRLLAQAGFIRSAFGEVDAAEQLLGDARAIAERTGLPAARGFAGFITGMHCMSYSRLREAADWLTRAREWAIEGNDLWTASQASSFRRHILFALGELDHSPDAMTEEEKLARKAGNFLAVCETKWIGSGLACLQGRLEEAEALGKELLRLIDASHADSGRPGALINLSYISFLSGDTESFESLLADAMGIYKQMSAAPIDDPQPVLLLLRALAGRREDALALLPDLERYFNFDDPWTASVGEARVTIAAALSVLGDSDRLSHLYPALREWTATTAYVLTGASTVPQLVGRILGMAAGMTGDRDQASAHFKQAIARAGELRLDAELAECHYWYAHFLAGGGREERAEALAHLDRAAARWQAAGMQKQIERAETLRTAI